jgi:hypothetical protein
VSGCGALVEFRSAQSTIAVPTARVNRGAQWRRARLGKMAELFDDFSPLQLQASAASLVPWCGRSLVGGCTTIWRSVWTEWSPLLTMAAQAT